MVAQSHGFALALAGTLMPACSKQAIYFSYNVHLIQAGCNSMNKSNPGKQLNIYFENFAADRADLSVLNQTDDNHRPNVGAISKHASGKEQL